MRKIEFLDGTEREFGVLIKADLRGADLYGAYLYGTKLRGADLRGADLRGANLHGANLCEAILREADLHGTSLLAYGNMQELRTMQFGRWAIGYTKDELQIGCQKHSIDKWRRWDTPAGRIWIGKMDNIALAWAKKNLDLVLAIIDANPAT